MPDKDIRINTDPAEAGAAPDPSAEEKAMAADSASTDAEMAKLAADMEELRQTLLRRQADFENYRKRIEKERGEDSRRTTARVVEALIPVIDGFEHALAAHRETEYENYRKGFELIYKQLLDNITKLGVERTEPTGKPFDPASPPGRGPCRDFRSRRRHHSASLSAGLSVSRARSAACHGACSGKPESRHRREP